jgi:hypothetical protein
MGGKACPQKTGSCQRQTGRKSRAEADGKRRQEDLFVVKREEDGREEDPGFQTGEIIRFSDRR